MDTAFLVKLLNVAALVAMMLSIGLTVKFEEVLASARQVRLVVLGVAGNFVLVPLLTVGLLHTFQAPPLAAAAFSSWPSAPARPWGHPLPHWPGVMSRSPPA